MKQICLDTETTGLSPNKGDKLVEIACIEIDNYIPTGREYHQYINPERDMPQAAFNVHGLSRKFLEDYPSFQEVYQDFLAFIEDKPLVIHNASFDMKFLNYELQKVGASKIPMSRAIDSLVMARNKFPGSPASLDALCKRFNISLDSRDLHGALIDTQLLAKVYMHLCDGVSPILDLQKSPKTKQKSEKIQAKKRAEVLEISLSEEEKKAHHAFISRFKAKHHWE